MTITLLNFSSFAVAFVLVFAEYVISKSILKNFDTQFDANNRKDEVLAIIVVTRDLPNADDRNQRAVYLDDSSYFLKLNRKEKRSFGDAKNSMENFVYSPARIQADYLANPSSYFNRSVLRGSVWKGCGKKAAKQCKKACIKAYKTVCDDYKCKRGMKKAFKKECKRACKAKFT